MENNVKERKHHVVDTYHTCFVCKKKVYTGMADMKSWVYRYGKQFCCSYSCYCKANKLERQFRF